MANFEITGVRVEETSSDRHKHITHVRFGSNGGILTREIVVKDLRTPGGDRYYTYAGGKRADVIVAKCPDCTFRDYITTAPDSTTANNLLSLPRI